LPTSRVKLDLPWHGDDIKQTRPPRRKPNASM
jgi:hypothetical protein